MSSYCGYEGLTLNMLHSPMATVHATNAYEWLYSDSAAKEYNVARGCAAHDRDG